MEISAVQRNLHSFRLNIKSVHTGPFSTGVSGVQVVITSFYHPTPSELCNHSLVLGGVEERIKLAVVAQWLRC